MKKIKAEVAKLCSVTHDRTNDKVFITFEVIDDEYKDLVFRLARNDDVEVIFRGPNLDLIDHKSEEESPEEDS